MDDQNHHNFKRIEKAIGFIIDNYKDQPQLEEVAQHVHLSPFHFQRLFTDWAGISPKKFVQFLSVQHAKSLLSSNNVLSEAAFETGLSGTGRLHDLFVTIEGMTPGEYKKAAASLTIRYEFMDSPFGDVLVASTRKGICLMLFADDHEVAISEMQKRFSNAHIVAGNHSSHLDMQRFLNQDWDNLDTVKLHLKGTPFQLKVWQALLTIPSGKLSTYSDLSQQIDNPKAMRAVGSAVGANPIAYLIPCHRVIRSTGIFGQYHWGSLRKASMIGWESARLKSA